MKITKDEWTDSQKHELEYWQNQYGQGNPEQEHRWNWYAMYVFAGWWDRRKWVGSRLLDYGSGPQGVLHRIDAARKVAVDSLMSEYALLGYRVKDNGVDARCVIPDEVFDCIFCLNMLDHVEDPAAEIQTLIGHLAPGGELAICVDMRPPEKQDACHKLLLTDEYLYDLCRSNGLVGQRKIVPHQTGNPTKQWVAILKKQGVA